MKILIIWKHKYICNTFISAIFENIVKRARTQLVYKERTVVYKNTLQKKRKKNLHKQNSDVTIKNDKSF